MPLGRAGAGPRLHILFREPFASKSHTKAAKWSNTLAERFEPRYFSLFFSVSSAWPQRARSRSRYDPGRGLLLRGTLVTMDDRHSVVGNGSVLVRQDQIVAVWQGDEPPRGTPVDNAVVVDFGPTALIFPGMINLHNHPTYDVLRLWPAPSSDVQPTLGRPLGTEPYANRYQWNGVLGTSPEHRRLVNSPQLALALAQALGLEIELVKYAQVLALVGGETTNEGALPNPATDALLARNVEKSEFWSPAHPVFRSLDRQPHRHRFGWSARPDEIEPGRCLDRAPRRGRTRR